MEVALADLVSQYQAIHEDVDAAIQEVLLSGRYILNSSPIVAQFEEEVAALSGARFGVGVNSGTDALLLALRAHGIEPGDEVITPPFTFVATAETIAVLGARPVFADIDPRTYNLDPEATRAAVTPRTRAILPVDLFGQMADRDAFCAIADRHGLQLIWDSAQAIGATFSDKPLGAYPGSATLSFFPTKNLGACGDGGLVLTNDEAVRDRLLQYRFHGSGGGYYYSRVGYCSRLDVLQAAVLRVKLRHLPEWNRVRRQHAERYTRLLSEASVVLPYCDPRAGHVHHQFTLRHPRRGALQDYLARRGVGSGVYYPLALHLQEAYGYLGYKEGDFPHAERATAEVLSIPVHPDLTNEQVDYVSEQIRSFDRAAHDEAN